MKHIIVNIHKAKSKVAAKAENARQKCVKIEK